MNRQQILFVVMIILTLLVMINIYFSVTRVDLRKEDNEINKLALLHDVLTELHKELHTLHKSLPTISPLDSINNKSTSVQEPGVMNPHQIVGKHSAAKLNSINSDKLNITNIPVIVSAHENAASRIRRAVIFTMDSIASYERNSLSGGAAGSSQFIFW